MFKEFSHIEIYVINQCLNKQLNDTKQHILSLKRHDSTSDIIKKISYQEGLHKQISNLILKIDILYNY